MKPKELIRKLCKLEGLKDQVSIAQMSEIVGHISDLVYKGEDDVVCALIVNGKRRELRRRKKCLK